MKHPTFNVTSGAAHLLAHEDAELKPIDTSGVPDVKMSPALIDLGNNTSICTNVYQMNLIDPGNQVIDVLPAFKDLGAVFRTSFEGQSIADKLVNWTFFAPLAAILNFFGTFVSKLITYITSKFYTMNEVLAGDATQRTTFQIMNAICFGGLERIKKIWDIQANYKFPIGVPSPSEAASAFMANEIDECTFQTYVMAGDQKWLPYRQITRAGKFKFSALELMTLYKRDQIKRSDINTRLRELGSLHSEDEPELEQLFAQIPGPADIIRFMVRDTENPDVINTFKTDTNFDANFQGLLRDWARYQGVSEDNMRREWRAHWSIPSPTQLYEMLHRLRHDPVYSASHDVLGDVRAALIQQDILPYWIDALLAVSYHPLTRTDLNRAFERGWIDGDAYLTGMYNNGYSDDDSRTLLRFVTNEQIIAIKNSDWGRAYVQGHISIGQAIDQSQLEGFDPSLEARISEVLDPISAIELQTKQVQALIHQYKRCWITQDEMYKESDKMRIPASVIDWQLSWASEDSTCGSRREQASALCSALSEQVITASEYVSRMKKLRYDDTAINTYLTLCQNKIAAAQAREQLRQQKAAQKEAKAEQAAEQKAEKQAIAAANRIARQLATAERSRQARNKVLETATSLVDEYLTDANGNGATIVTGLYNMIMTEHGLSQNESAHVVAAVAARKVKQTVAEFSADVESVALASLTQPWILFPIGTPPKNGH
jgi:hypothetical protein